MPALLRAAVLAGLAAQLRAQGGNDPPSTGAPCYGCHCGDTDLSPYRNREFRTPADADGYIFLFQMCDPLTEAQLPGGCTTPGIPAFPAPAVVKYKDNNPLDCELIGSFGPCPDHAAADTCGMTYQPGTNGLAVTWQYEYGCTNTFRIFLGPGHETKPKQAPYNDPNDPYLCYWITNWASLSAFGHINTPGDTNGKEMHPIASFFLGCSLAFVVYLAVGTAYGVKVQGKVLGPEAVPHIELWRSVPGLVTEGVNFAKHKVSGGAVAALRYKGVDQSETEGLSQGGGVVNYGASADKGDYDTL